MFNKISCSQMFSHLKSIQSELTNQKKFSRVKRIHFNQLLGMIETSVKTQLPKVSSCRKRTLDQMIAIHSLNKRINKIRDLIYPITGKYWFHLKIQRLNDLLTRIEQTLEKDLKRSMQFPIDCERKLSDLTNIIRNELTVMSVNCPEELKKKSSLINKEAYHLIFDDIENEELEGIDVEKLEGNNVQCSLISLTFILEHYIQSDRLSFTHPVSILLKKLECSIKFCHKISVLQRSSLTKNRFFYYKALTSVFDSFRLYERNQNASMPAQDTRLLKEFYKNASLKNPEYIPKDVLINHTVWEMKNTIESLGYGDYCFFSIGTIRHEIIIEVSHLRPCSFFPQGEYIYTVFNTGDGCEAHFNRIKRKENYDRKPLTIKRLDKQAFTYEFLEEMVKNANTQDKIEVFYKIHTKHLIQKAGGILFKKSGKWYPEQKRETCTFSALEACVFSHLSPVDIQKIKKIKIIITIDKQKKLIDQSNSLKKRKIPTVLSQEIKKKIKIFNESILNENQLILKVCENYLKRVNQAQNL